LHNFGGEGKNAHKTLEQWFAIKKIGFSYDNK
jgi:hypothetical protein